MSTSKVSQSIGQRIRILKRGLAGAAMLAAFLQGAFFFFQGLPRAVNLLGVVLAITSIVAIWRWVKSSGALMMGVVLTLFVAQLGLFTYHLMTASPQFSYRLLQVGILLLYGSTLLMVLLGLIRRLDPANAILLASAVAVAVFLAELSVAPFYSQWWSLRHPEWSNPKWEGTIRSHPILGEVYSPNGWVKIHYPDNTRDYFKEEGGIRSSWNLRVHQSSVARLVFSTGASGGMRIEITEADRDSPPSHINLNQSPLAIVSGQSYTLTFRVRADAARLITYAVGQAHEPWENLGLYREVGVTTEWQDIQAEFTATDSDTDARIHFDIGGSAISLELSEVQLISLPDGRPVIPTVETKYVVNYRFNSLGCRGRDYTIPRPPGVFRILALGDSFTMGVGVHEKDVFTTKLEALLNERTRAASSQTTYEVVNCGVSGFGTREERLFYELIASKYEPNIVLVAMMENDDSSWIRDLEMGYVHFPAKLEHLFYTLHAVQRKRHERPPPEYTACMSELRNLKESASRQGARLGVVAFRNAIGPKWERIVATASASLSKESVPFRDLGVTLLKHHSFDELKVHNIDGHPNELAHELAAEEILRFLDAEGYLRHE